MPVKVTEARDKTAGCGRSMFCLADREVFIATCQTVPEKTERNTGRLLMTSAELIGGSCRDLSCGKIHSARRWVLDVRLEAKSAEKISRSGVAVTEYCDGAY